MGMESNKTDPLPADIRGQRVTTLIALCRLVVNQPGIL